MEERKYLEDVPRDVQDLILDGSPEPLIKLMADRGLSREEVREIRTQLFQLNPDIKPHQLSPKEQKQMLGCLSGVIGFIFCILSMALELGAIAVVGIFLMIGGLVAFGARSSDIAEAMKPKPPEPKTPVLPKQSELVSCKTCNAEISKTAPVCPHCGENLPGFRVHCPKCNSSNIGIGAKGYSLGKAAAGALVFGAGGLVVGLHGRKNMELQCLSCGKKWKPQSLK